jgi:polyhydroxyalkanoate synthesis regulator phasin
MEDLSLVVGCGQPWAHTRAQTALEVSDALKAGTMSKDEAKEILQDLIDTDKLDADATDVKIKAALVFGVTELIKACA